MYYLLDGGYPNAKDEPQHMIQGRSLIKTLNSFDIRFCELKKKILFKNSRFN